MSLKERCEVFKKRYSSAYLNPTLLNKIYRENKIKRKVIKLIKTKDAIKEEKYEAWRLDNIK